MPDSSTGVSVVVCCYNSSARLPATLEHLAHQSLPAGLPVEVIVVDNNSKDRTAETALGEWERLGNPSRSGRSTSRFRAWPMPGSWASNPLAWSIYSFATTTTGSTRTISPPPLRR
ncbi:MAG: glycosyltransferase [Saprospirales bacterium]|nr:glycosyltransferase [Saprospirales bacterium]